MNGCTAGILVVAYLVLVSMVVDFIVSRRIAKRLDRIEELLVSTTKESLDNGNKVANSKGK